MMSMNRRAGVPIKFAYSAKPAAEAVAIPILDANDNVVTLQAYQRLVIDDINFNTDAAADTSDLAYIIEASSTPAAIPTTGVVVAFSIAVNLGTQGALLPAEGYSCVTANKLYLFDPATSLESTDVVISGTGRIVEVTHGPQAGYKAPLTAGSGNNAWNGGVL
jgi:hypothetical protein